MAFTPPAFQLLSVNTSNLDTKFSIKLGRYNIVDSSVPMSSTEKDLKNLNVLIARSQKVINCKTKRITQREVINTLVIELSELVKSEEKEKYGVAAQFLLGALLHRYFRLIKEYEPYTYCFIPTYVTNCELFLAIRTALNLPSDVTGDYKKRDLAVLDATTIVTALETFRDCMKVLDKNKNPRINNYPHLATDSNYQTYLQNIIDEHKPKAEPFLKQYKAIRFIQSLTTKVEDEGKKIEEELIKWSKLLEKEYINFNILTADEIDKHIVANIKTESVRENIRDLLFTPQITQKLQDMNHATFLEAMKKCQADRASYTLLGGYSLLLQSSDVNQLKHCIYEALGTEERPNAINDNDMLFSINRFLKPFLEENPDIVLNYEFFGGKDQMSTFMTKRIEALVISTKDKAETKGKQEDVNTQAMSLV